MIRRIIYFLLATLVFGGLAGAIAWYAFDFKPKFLAEIILNSPRPPETIASEAAMEESWQPNVSAIGTIAALERIDVAPQVGGVVKELFFDSGDKVKAGAKLVQLDTETEEAELKTLKVQLANAERELTRKDEVLKRGFGVAADRDSAQSLRDQLMASIERMEAQIRQKTVLAPWDGQLGLREVSVGTYLAAGTRVAELQKVNEVFVDFPVTEKAFGGLQQGQRITASFNAWPGQTYAGEIVTTDTALDPQSRTVTVRGRLANTDGKLLPGMYAAVNIDVGTPEKFVTVAQTAVTFSLYGDSVFAVVPASKLDPKAKPEEKAVEKRFVKTGQVRDGRIAILEGVKPGEEIVIAGQNKIDQGSKVVVNNSLALKPAQNATLQ